MQLPQPTKKASTRTKSPPTQHIAPYRLTGAPYEAYTMQCVKEVRETQDRVPKEKITTSNIVSHEKSGRENQAQPKTAHALKNL